MLSPRSEPSAAGSPLPRPAAFLPASPPLPRLPALSPKPPAAAGYAPPGLGGGEPPARPPPAPPTSPPRGAPALPGAPQNQRVCGERGEGTVRAGRAAVRSPAPIGSPLLFEARGETPKEGSGGGSGERCGTDRAERAPSEPNARRRCRGGRGSGQPGLQRRAGGAKMRSKVRRDAVPSLRTERCRRGASPPAAVLSAALQMASRLLCEGQKQRRSEVDNRATWRNAERAEGCVHQTHTPRSEAVSHSAPRPSSGKGLMLESSEQDSSINLSGCGGQPIPEGIATLQPPLPHPTALPRWDQLQPHLSSTFQFPPSRCP